MTTDTKKLAEFAAVFLGGKYDTFCWLDNNTFPVYLTELNFFEYNNYAPILAHLAKREMEKRGFEWNAYTMRDAGKTVFGIKIFGSDSNNYKEVEKFADNEYIALWTAIQEAVDKK